ncbi:maleylacetoacetate isomerase [Paraburkholderia caribensis]|uniref:maleylacetoacetate isomerase n=1 Tax=Paraburkholderia caribensis TaxID=75105 RepID=UPI001CB2EBE5|nr:maleylacetoacetate isomerase [Paraburkholderia caribensis]CAG9263126.1 Maleylacetoacetate isomerase [Paraburkholderia caribensis]
MNESTREKNGIHTTNRTLYTYFRSSAAYRVRIALSLKGLDYDSIPVHLVRDGGEQHKPTYREVNPFGLVPSYVENGRILRQSLAIIEYINECHPEPPLLPLKPYARAEVRELALSIACDIHPLNNTRILKYLQHEIHADDEARVRWMRHWMQVGFGAFETLLSAMSDVNGPFCYGEVPTIADCCLIPQLFNARRFGVDLTAFPRLVEIDSACQDLEAFRQAHPSRQPDSEA